MDGFDSLVRFFQEGGAFMYPIGLTLAAGIAITVERYVFLARTTASNRRDYERLLPLMQNGRLREALAATQESTSAVARILGEALGRLPGSRRRSDLELAMEEGMLEALPSIEKRTGYLATFANIATLLGLLGTIIGLISAFSAVAEADASQKAALLSSSISVAMNTTAFGLIVAIPLLLAHSYLQSRTVAITESLSIAMVKFLNHIERRHTFSSPAPAPATESAAVPPTSAGGRPAAAVA